MALFRVETVEDITTGLFSAEVYFPEDADEPYIVTKAQHPSHEAALKYVADTFKSSMPGEDVQVKVTK